VRRSFAAPATALAFAALIVAVHAAATRTAASGRLWGADAYAFVPGVWRIAGVVVVVLAAIPLVLALRATNDPAGPAAAPTHDTLAAPAARAPLAEPLRAFAIAAVALAAGCLMWLARSRHVLLGDGLPIVAGLARESALHGFEPLTVLLQQFVLGAMRPLAPAAMPTWRVTWDSVALVSTLSGVAFVPVAWALAGEIERGDGANAPSNSARAWIFAALLLQGELQLFCGYVENYAPVALANAIVLWTGLRCARGRGSLLASGVAITLAIGLHLSAAALLPAWLVLAAWSVTKSAGRRRARLDLLFVALIAAAMTAALALRQPGYLLPRTLWDVAITAVGQRQEHSGYLFSLHHLGEFLNEQMLIGPLGLFVFLAGAAAAMTRGRWRSPDVRFALLAGAGMAGACAVAGDSNLGYARNWDLLAPAAAVLTGAGLALLRPLSRSARSWRALLLLAAAVSAFHTLPWIAVNASADRAVARFKTLPLGLGRTESTVGLWYEMQGRMDLAETWFKLSLDKDPANTRAHAALGELYLATGRPNLAVAAYSEAVRLRPDKDDYRMGLTRALVAGGHFHEAREIVEADLRARPDHATMWAVDGLLLYGDGHEDYARMALARARVLAPSDTLIERIERGIGSDADFRRTLAEDWPRLTAR
jgi:tetratricopeptide (TPR) repeat protein